MAKTLNHKIVSPEEMRLLKKGKGVTYANRARRRALGNPETFLPMKPGFVIVKEKQKAAAICKECKLRPRANGSSRCLKCKRV